MTGNIFINYRRGDDPGFTQALYSRLEQAFPPERLFMDVDNIAPGLDFVQVLNEQVARCDVLIAVIGKNWLAADESGQRRLDNPEDFVRIEIELALSQKKRVIPVLVNDATMPRSTELPEALKPFARCHAVRLTHERFRADTQSLVKALEKVLAETEAARRDEAEHARRAEKARAKDEAERLRRERREQSRKVQGEKIDARPRGETTPQARPRGVMSFIAGLPSDADWRIPIAATALVLLGWTLPGYVFMPPEHGGLGWGTVALLYGLAGLVAIGVAFYVRRSALGGAELALYWLALVRFIGLAVFSLSITVLGQTPSYLPIAALAILMAA